VIVAAVTTRSQFRGESRLISWRSQRALVPCRKKGCIVPSALGLHDRCVFSHSRQSCRSRELSQISDPSLPLSLSADQRAKSVRETQYILTGFHFRRIAHPRLGFRPSESAGSLPADFLTLRRWAARPKSRAKSLFRVREWLEPLWLFTVVFPATAITDENNDT